jgi:two-component system chemotaxis sensor kinase CheA
MDVVRNTVEELGGKLDFATERGRFTRFTIELPVTLAIADALIVTAGGQKFAIPQASVKEIIEIEADAFTAFEGNEMLSYREGVMPLIRLARYFGLTETGLKKFFALVIGDGIRSMALVVERISGLREIVVRAINDKLAQVEGIAGATELGDGRLILILDSAALLRLGGEKVKPRS